VLNELRGMRAELVGRTFLPAIEPIKPIEIDELTYRAGISPIILIMIGITSSLMSGFILVFVGSQFSFDADDYYLMMFAYMELFVGFILVTVGLHSYPKNRMNSLSSFGWWLFFIGTWFEIFFIRWLAPDIECSTIPMTGEHWCEPSVHYIALSFIFPAIAMLLGLMLVYIGKKKKKNQPSSRSDISPR